MPKCQKCLEMLPPNFCSPIDAQDPEIVECVFCKRDVKALTVTKDDKVEIYTKEECKQDYVRFLNYMKEKAEKLDAARELASGNIILPGDPKFEETLKGG
jgi:wyosine [tRNA(Phe)-imidazoG37] synthetase (radical SAM superfamily)